MKQTSFIRVLLAFTALSIFTVSITPKLYLHNMMVKHRDAIVPKGNDGHLKISRSVFNCDCNTLVATAPFIGQDEILIPSSSPSYFEFVTTLETRIFSSIHSFFELRGPPALIS